MASLPTREETLAGWGHVPVLKCVTARPEKRADLSIAAKQESSLVARGLGRSYGDAALNPKLTVRMERFDHFLAFDNVSGILTGEAGLSFADILSVCVPQGWILPVIPGTKQVTLGGAFACNVHGKNQYAQGEFARHVLSIKLRLADGRQVQCSAHEHGDIFWATAGGMGMTGIIEEVTLQLKRIDSVSLRTHSRRVYHLDSMIDCFEQKRGEAEYMVGWIDHTAGGDELGRGVFEHASHISETDGGKPLASFALKEPHLKVPFTLPGFVINRRTMAFYNALRFHRERDDWQERIKGFDGFFHPLDGIKDWWRLYGKRGFYQYQCLVPENGETRARLFDLLKLIHAHNAFSTLAVLKYHGDPQGMLSFSKRGYSLALDFPNTRKTRALIPQLNDHVASIGGRVYLAKDALLTPEQFERMYAETLLGWRDVIHRIDPGRRFDSLLAERINLRGDHD